MMGEPLLEARSHDSHCTPMMLAAVFPHGSCVPVIVSFGADPNLQNVDGHTALHVAVRRKSVGAI